MCFTVYNMLICRYVCLFASKIGYSLSTAPNAICNFTSIDDIFRAVPAEPESQFHDEECSFIVQVHKKGEDGVISESDQHGLAHKKLSFEFTARNKFNKETRICPRPYYFKATSIAERDQWISAINSALRANQREKEYKEIKNKNLFRRLQPTLRSIYSGLWFQFATALLVALNFFLTVSKFELCWGFCRD
jgi:hypothetical protein